MTSAKRVKFLFVDGVSCVPVDKVATFVSCPHAIVRRGVSTFWLSPIDDHKDEAYTSDKYEAIIEPVRNRKGNLRDVLRNGQCTHHYLCSVSPLRESILEFYDLGDDDEAH